MFSFESTSLGMPTIANVGSSSASKLPSHVSAYVMRLGLRVSSEVKKGLVWWFGESRSRREATGSTGQGRRRGDRGVGEGTFAFAPEEEVFEVL